MLHACCQPLVLLSRGRKCSKACVLTALLAGVIAVVGCGSDDEPASDRPSGSEAAQGDNANEPANSGSGAAEETSTEERQGESKRTEQGTQGSQKSTSERQEEERVAQLIERMRDAESREPNEELGCERYTTIGAQGPYPSIGPPPPHIKVSRVPDGALISYRFSSLPNNETCRPFGLYMTVLGTNVPNRSRTFEKRTEDVRLRGLSGKRVVEFPLAGKPPYRVSVASFSITGRSGPRVTMPVP